MAKKKRIKNETIKQRILNSPNKLIEECENSLASLWRIILQDLNIDEDRWESLMNNYLTDPLNGFDDETSTLGDKRGNLNKALCYTDMQMLIFNRALRFLQTERVTLIFTLYPNDPEDFPTSTYDINIFYGKNEVIQKERVLEEGSATPVVGRKRFVSAFQKQSVDVNIKRQSDTYTIEQWLDDPKKMTSSATGPLSKIWRRILADRRINLSIWKTLIVKYQRKIAPDCFILTGKETPTELKIKSKRKSNVKGNIIDQLRGSSFTIDVFMKAMVFLEVKTVDITIRLKRVNCNRITSHTLEGWNPETIMMK